MQFGNAMCGSQGHGTGTHRASFGSAVASTIEHNEYRRLFEYAPESADERRQGQCNVPSAPDQTTGATCGHWTQWPVQDRFRP
jgi:hypothetical protein